MFSCFSLTYFSLIPSTYSDQSIHITWEVIIIIALRWSSNSMPLYDLQTISTYEEEGHTQCQLNAVFVLQNM